MSCFERTKGARRASKGRFAASLACASGSPSFLACVILLLLHEFVSAQEPRKVSDFGGDFIQQLTWSPDGSKFLFTRIHQGKMGLWTMNADGTGAKALFPKETNPTLDAGWHPDGQRIIYVFDRLQ